MTAGEARDAGTQTGSGDAPPDNPEELGDTVEALAAKADVKARAQQRASEVSGQLKGRVGEVKAGLASRVDQLKGGLADKAGETRQAGTSAWEAAPEPVQNGARRVARTVDQHRVPSIAIAAGATLLAGWLAFRWLRR